VTHQNRLEQAIELSTLGYSTAWHDRCGAQ